MAHFRTAQCGKDPAPLHFFWTCQEHIGSGFEWPQSESALDRYSRSVMDEDAAEASIQKGTWLVAVHVGAGYHSPANVPKYRKAMLKACEAKMSRSH